MGLRRKGQDAQFSAGGDYNADGGGGAVGGGFYDRPDAPAPGAVDTHFDRAEFPGVARAGDRILLDVEVILSRPEGTLCRGVASVDGREIGRTEYMIVFVPPEMEPPLDPAAEERRRLLRRAVGLDVKESS